MKRIKHVWNLDYASIRQPALIGAILMQIVSAFIFVAATHLDVVGYCAFIVSAVCIVLLAAYAKTTRQTIKDTILATLPVPVIVGLFLASVTIFAHFQNSSFPLSKLTITAQSATLLLVAYMSITLPSALTVRACKFVLLKVAHRS